MKKILIIEDESDLREEVAEILEQEGHDVYQADSGKIGLMIAKDQIPNLILCDVMMPDMNGFEVLEQWKKENSYLPVPFIFMTALSERQNFRKGMEIGADDYLTKPFTHHELLGAVQSRLDKYSKIENIIRYQIEKIENDLHGKLLKLNSEIEANRNTTDETIKHNISLRKLLEEKEIELMEEVMRLVETRNSLHNIKTIITRELQNKNITDQEKEVLLNLKNRLNYKSMASNNWALFHIKVNQLFPGFIAKLSQMQPNLTQYELVFVSAMKIGMNTKELAQLLNISDDSVRKSRYRIKKKFGVGKENSFFDFLHSNYS